MVSIGKDLRFAPLGPPPGWGLAEALRKALAPVERPDGPMVWDTTPTMDDSFRHIWFGTTDNVLEGSDGR